jgi:hypothetical protein
LRAGNARSYGLEEVVIFAPVFKISCGQSGTAISPSLSAMTGLAGLRVQIPAGGNCGRITGKRILYRIGRIPSLCDYNPGTQTYRCYPEINTSSFDLVCP